MKIAQEHNRILQTATIRRLKMRNRANVVLKMIESFSPTQRQLLSNMLVLMKESSNNVIELVDTIEKLSAEADPTPSPRRHYILSESEYKRYIASGSRKLLFESGGGIGIRVSYEDVMTKKWIDITDYNTW